VPASKRLEWSPRAGRDLLAIETFCAGYSQVTANRVIAEIRRNALLLETHPQIGRRVRIGRVLHQHQKYPV
jgi:plasmid stabilization system protein ParE